MRALLGGPWASHSRAAALAAIIVAALVDVAALVVLLAAGGGSPDDPTPPAAAPFPADVARTVVQAVADGDCSDLDPALAEDADLPFTVTACVAGDPATVDLADVEVLGTTADGADVAAVTVAVTADGQAAEIVLDLRRDDGRWQVTGIRAAG